MTFPLIANIDAKVVVQQETSTPGQYLKNLMDQYPDPESVLVIMDLDDTTITTPKGQLLGRSEMFRHLLAREQKAYPDKTKSDLVKIIDPLLEAVYERVAVIPTDDTLPAVLNHLNHRNIRVIGMTARGKGVSDVTRKQLRRANIHFMDTGVRKIIPLEDRRSALIEHGVVMVGHGNKKGETIVALLENRLLGKAFPQILLIDDRQYHLDDMAGSLNKYDKNIRFKPVLCTYLSTLPKFDDKASEEELLALLAEKRNDAIIGQFIKNDTYTKSLISQCGGDFGKTDQYCKTIRGPEPTH